MGPAWRGSISLFWKGFRLILLLGSLTLAVFNCAALYLISHHRARLGWILTLALQLLWIPYDIVTGQYGFLLICILTTLVALKSWKKVEASASARREAPEWSRGDDMEVDRGVRGVPGSAVADQPGACVLEIPNG